MWRCWFPPGAILKRGCRSGETSGASQVVAGEGRLQAGVASLGGLGRGVRRLCRPDCAALSVARGISSRVGTGAHWPACVRAVLGLVGVIESLKALRKRQFPC